MPCTHLEMNIPFFVRCSVHHAMNVASKSMGSRDAQIEDILASCDLLYLLAVHQHLLIVRLIKHLVHGAGGLQYVFQGISWTLLS